MQSRNRPNYTIQGRDVIAEGADMKVSILTLAAGQGVPWHHHSDITDRFFCMDGPMVVETRAPDATHVLKPGETCTVQPMTMHHVHGQDNGPCRFMLVQGVGVYDFVPDE